MTQPEPAASADAASPLRILQLSLWNTPGGGGTQTYLRALLQAFRGSADVHLLGAAVNPGAQQDGFVEPIHLGQAGRAPWRNALAFCRHLWRAARRAHLVQINGIYGPHFMLGAPCCWLLGVPYVVNPLNALAPWMLAQKAWKKRLFFGTYGGFLLRKAACVLGTSGPEAEFIARRFPRAKVRLVLVGIEVPAQPAVEWLQAPATPALRVLYLGSFDPWKRVPMLVRAIAALRAQGIDAQATICGYGASGSERPVTDEIARLDLGRAVTMAGYVAGARKLALLRQSHLLVLPSVTDSYSLATAEALAQGLPVVITEGAGAAPDVRRHDCGTVVPVDDEAALVAAMREYVTADVRRARAINAHRYARAVLDLEVLRDAMTALYRGLARR